MARSLVYQTEETERRIENQWRDIGDLLKSDGGWKQGELASLGARILDT